MQACPSAERVVQLPPIRARDAGFKHLVDVAGRPIDDTLRETRRAALLAAFEKNIMDHIAVYGPDNDKRLTGKHETAPWNKFSYGIADRGASIRVPHSFANSGYKGYLEDRRPSSQGDPYQIASQILKTIASVPTGAKAAA